MLQIMASRLGVVTGRDLAQICRAEYPRPAAYGLWVMTELAIIGSDIQELVGSAIALKSLFGLDLWIGCLITGLDTFTFMLAERYGIRKLEALVCGFIATMTICFFVSFGISQPNGLLILKGSTLPYVPEYAVVQAVGIIGAVIMPHNIYLHSSLVKSRMVARNNPAKVAEANKYNAMESSLALLVSFFINAAVVCVFAHGFFNKHCAQLPGTTHGLPPNLACVPA